MSSADQFCNRQCNKGINTKWFRAFISLPRINLTHRDIYTSFLLEINIREVCTRLAETFYFAQCSQLFSIYDVKVKKIGFAAAWMQY